MHFLPFSVLENKFVFYRQIIHETQGRILTCSCQSMSVPTVFFLSFDWANTGILKWELNMFSWGVILESNLFSGNILVLISVVLCSLTFILLFNLTTLFMIYSGFLFLHIYDQCSKQTWLITLCFCGFFLPYFWHWGCFCGYYSPTAHLVPYCPFDIFVIICEVMPYL